VLKIKFFNFQGENMGKVDEDGEVIENHCRVEAA
jgi:hypothetical protein